MDSKENQADTPADNNPASDVSPAPIENASAQTDAQPSAPEPAKHPRLSESRLESAHAELPPLSSISKSGNVTEDSGNHAGNASENRTQTRRGLGRSTGGRSGSNQQRPAIGVVENPTEMTENLSGQFVAGYGERTERRERPERAERPERRRETPATPEKTETAGDAGTQTPAASEGPREFVPPVSQGTYKAEMNPERERQAREEKRRERQPFNRDEAGQQPGQQRPERRGSFREQAREHPQSQGKSEWTPTARTGGNAGAQTGGGNSRQKLIIEPAKMPVQPQETFFGKVKKFFGKIFGVSEPKPAAKPFQKNERDGKDRYRNERGGDRGGSRGNNRGGRGNDRSRGGDFRHGNRSGSQNQGFNRDGRHRPHPHGGNTGGRDSHHDSRPGE